MRFPSTFAALALCAALALAAPAWGQMPLNTGYNHAANDLYPTTATARDNYWIAIAAYPAINPAPPILSIPVAPNGWPPALGNSRWLGARPGGASDPTTKLDDPGYILFRKCFCLLQSFRNAQMRFQLRADDNVQVWLNTQLTQLVAPTGGLGNPVANRPTTQSDFRVGRNCLYVLVEDWQQNRTGFDLEGSVTAEAGLVPLPAAGVAQRFEPCQCPTTSPTTNRASEVDDEKMVAEILKTAEARRVAKKSKQ